MTSWQAWYSSTPRTKGWDVRAETSRKIRVVSILSIRALTRNLFVNVCKNRIQNHFYTFKNYSYKPTNEIGLLFVKLAQEPEKCSIRIFSLISTGNNVLYSYLSTRADLTRS